MNLAATSASQDSTGREVAWQVFLEEKEKDEKKDIINTDLATRAELEFPLTVRSEAKALVLDGITVRSATALIGAGFRPHNVIACNAFPDVTENIRKHVDSNPELAGLVVLEQLVYDAMVRQPQILFSVVYLDYTSTWNGNPWCKPYIDTEELFARGLLTSVALLYLTISLRGKSSTHKGRKSPQRKHAKAPRHAGELETWIKLPIV